MPSVKTKTRHLMRPRTQGIWEYKIMDVTTYPARNGATAALLADVTDQPENTVAPTSELLANPRMFNVIGRAKSRQNPNSALFGGHEPTLRPP
jgi:hypothetical protein